MLKLSGNIAALTLLLLVAASARAQVRYGFEDGVIPANFKLSQGSHWRITGQSLAGRYSLCDSVGQGIAADHTFAFDAPVLPDADADTFEITFKFVYGGSGNGSAPTIGGNHFQVFIGANSDSLSLNNSGLEAFVLSFVGTSGNDTLRLYHKLKNLSLTINAASAIVSTAVRANNALLRVRLVRSAEGALTLWAGSPSDMRGYAAGGIYHRAGCYAGVRLAATTTNSRKYLVVDDIYARFTQINTTAMPYGSIVFSELMARPAGSGFQEEYIELYNRTDRPIDLSGWMLDHSVSRPVVITAGVVPAKSYIMLNFTPRDDENCTIATLSGIPTLTDKGKRLTLRTPQGAVAASVAYSDAWYGDPAKSEGGFSLEKIDPDNLEESPDNWTASAAQGGGTPCAPNSVQAPNPDRNLPLCTGYQIAGSTLTLAFNEPLLADILTPSRFECGGRSPLAASCTPDDPMTLTLVFDRPFAENTPCLLQADNAVADLNGNGYETFELPVGIGSAPQAGDVVINEILFNPKTGGVDFVELYNVSGKLLELKGSKISNRKMASGALDRVYGIERSYVMHPQEWAVVCANPAIVCQHYHCEHPTHFITMPSMPAYPNDEGCAVFLDAQDGVIDEFCYSEKMHISLLNSVKGVSLERVNPLRPASEWANWFSAAQTAGFATPSYQNSQYSQEAGGTEDGISLSPAVFSPDGDGIDDALFIDYAMPSEGWIASAYVYDVQGRLVRILCKNALLGKNGRLLWDGAAEQGTPAIVGRYIILIETYHQSGKTQVYKKTATLGGRL